MVTTHTTDIEKESLEAHVELCAIRYGNLDKRLENLENRVESIETHVVGIKEAIETSSHGQSKQLIAIGTTIIGVLITAIFGLVMHLASK